MITKEKINTVGGEDTVKRSVLSPPPPESLVWANCATSVLSPDFRARTLGLDFRPAKP